MRRRGIVVPVVGLVVALAVCAGGIAVAADGDDDGPTPSRAATDRDCARPYVAARPAAATGRRASSPSRSARRGRPRPSPSTRPGRAGPPRRTRRSGPRRRRRVHRPRGGPRPRRRHQRRGRRRPARARLDPDRRLAVRLPNRSVPGRRDHGLPARRRRAARADGRGGPRRGRPPHLAACTTAAPSASGPTATCTPGSATAAGSATHAANAQDGSTLLGKLLRIDPTPEGAEPVRGARRQPVRRPRRLAARDLGARGAQPVPPHASTPRPATCGSATSASRAGRSSTSSPRTTPAPTSAGTTARARRPSRAATSPGGALEPVHAYGHRGGFCAVVAGVVVDDPSLPMVDGLLLFTDYCKGRIMAFRPGGDGGPPRLLDTGARVERPVAIAVGPDGTHLGPLARGTGVPPRGARAAHEVDELAVALGSGDPAPGGPGLRRARRRAAVRPGRHRRRRATSARRELAGRRRSRPRSCSSAHALCIFLAYGTTARRRPAARRRRGARRRPTRRSRACGWRRCSARCWRCVGWPLAPALVVAASAARARSPSTPCCTSGSRCSGLPALLGVLAGTGYLRGLQDTRTPLVVALGSAARQPRRRGRPRSTASASASARPRSRRSPRSGARPRSTCARSGDRSGASGSAVGPTRRRCGGCSSSPARWSSGPRPCAARSCWPPRWPPAWAPSRSPPTRSRSRSGARWRSPSTPSPSPPRRMVGRLLGASDAAVGPDGRRADPRARRRRRCRRRRGRRRPARRAPRRLHRRPPPSPTSPPSCCWRSPRSSR